MNATRWALASVVLVTLAACTTTTQAPPTDPTKTTPTATTTTTPVTTNPPAPAASELVLTGSKVGSVAMGTPQPEAEEALEAILGEATESSMACEASGERWNVLEWGDLRVTFLASGSGTASDAALDGWILVPRGSAPDVVSLQDDLPLSATFAELTASTSDLTQHDVFGTGEGPWIAEVRLNLTYHWDEKEAESIRIDGGEQRTCE